jgi:hypothetical protein
MSYPKFPVISNDYDLALFVVKMKGFVSEKHGRDLVSLYLPPLRYTEGLSSLRNNMSCYQFENAWDNYFHILGIFVHSRDMPSSQYAYDYQLTFTELLNNQEVYRTTVNDSECEE